MGKLILKVHTKRYSEAKPTHKSLADKLMEGYHFRALVRGTKNNNEEIYEALTPKNLRIIEVGETLAQKPFKY